MKTNALNGRQKAAIKHTPATSQQLARLGAALHNVRTNAISQLLHSFEVFAMGQIQHDTHLYEMRRAMRETVSTDIEARYEVEMEAHAEVLRWLDRKRHDITSGGAL